MKNRYDGKGSAPNMAVEQDSQKLRFWFPTLRSGCLSLLRWASRFMELLVSKLMSLCALAAMVSGPALADTIAMGIPDQSWKVSFDAPPLTKRKETNTPKQYMYLGNAGRFNLSLYIEDPSCDGGSTHEEYLKCFLPNALRSPIMLKDSVRTSCNEKFCKLSYLTTSSTNVPVYLLHANFLIAYRGKWIDLHFSAVRPTDDAPPIASLPTVDEDIRVFEKLGNSLRYGEIQ